MIEHGLYIVKEKYFNLVKNLGGNCDIESGNKRPTYCCLKDNRIYGLYWAIPTSDLEHRDEQQKQKYNFYMNQSEKDLRSCYYHIAKTTKEALYKISSAFPITEKYIDYEYTTYGKHVIMQNKSDIAEIERKLKKILAFEFRKINYFSQHISDIRNFLILELEQQESQQQIATTSDNKSE